MNAMYPTLEPFIALTDKAWFDFLTSRAVGGRVDEVNFWQPSATAPMKKMTPGETIFFRLKKPDYSIAGYGFFAHFDVVDLHTAWAAFGWKNGDPDKRRFFERIGGYRGMDLLAPGVQVAPIGCTILREATFWPRERWIRWSDAEGWAPNIVQGKTERDRDRAMRLVEAVRADARRVPEDLSGQFVPLDVDERTIVMREVTQREGQGAFRLRLLDAYDRQCAITGEHTEPVLDAAHIQPYLGARSNHVQNGLLLTKEFHALFDAGYVGVTPDYEVRVSERLREEWKNGRRYTVRTSTLLQRLRDFANSDAHRAAKLSKELIEGLDLDPIVDERNQCAHPHKLGVGRAERCRAIVPSAIDRYLGAGE